MHLTFKPLWKLLIDKEMSREQLKELSGLSSATMAKLSKDGTVTTPTLVRICEALDCELNEICEVIKEENK
ncbi:helix-turn-helix domain-containing protein [Alloscardovia omnicolens]|uniref:helix-turn-helix domain-containing protein n=1 Tax=Alloscardovia omnicolens TaxID=419015 RepID=UPI003A74E9CD